MNNSPELLTLIHEHHHAIQQQVAANRLASSQSTQRPQRVARFLANLGRALITLGESLRRRYDGICDTITCSNESPTREDRINARA